MTIITDLNFFDTVYLVTDPDQVPRQITGMIVGPAENGHHQIKYEISYGSMVSHHYRQEMTTKKDERKILF